MGREYISLSPAEVNSILKEACGSGLFPFADAIHTVVTMKQIDRDGDTIMYGWGTSKNPTSKEWGRLKKRFETLRKNCVEDVIDYQYAYWGIESAASRAYYKGGAQDVGTEIILSDYPKLRDFCSFLDDNINNINQQLRNASIKKKGAPLQKINLLFAFWGFIWAGYLDRHKPSVKYIDWGQLVNVYEWFWNRIGKYGLYESIKPKSQDLDPEYFKNQFYKHRLRNAKIFKYGSYIPARRGFLRWLGKRRFWAYHWSEINLIDTSKMDSNLRFDDKKRAIETLRMALAGKEKFKEAVMLPDLTYSID